MQIPLGVVTKNEQKLEDMIDIVEILQKYVPRTVRGKSKVVFFHGDQLTCERLRGVKRARMQCDDPVKRFSTIVEVPGDWHALLTFYQV